MSAYHETKVHGTHGFPYIVYLGILPEYISGIPHVASVCSDFSGNS